MINDQADAVDEDAATVPFVVRPVRRMRPEPVARPELAARPESVARMELAAPATPEVTVGPIRGAGAVGTVGSVGAFGSAAVAEPAAVAGTAAVADHAAPAHVVPPEQSGEPMHRARTARRGRPGRTERAVSGPVSPLEAGTAARRETALSDDGDPPESIDAVDEWAPFGPLAPFVARPGVTDVFVNGADGLWFDDGAGLQHDDGWWCDERGLRDLAVRLVSLGGRHVDEATPCVDVRLRGGMRVHVVLPPISTGGTLVSIRIPRRASFRFEELVAAGMVDGWQSERLRAAIAARENLLITGPAGSGKTTLLSALLAEAPESERLVCIEDVAELRVRHPHVVSMEARQSNLEGAGEVPLARLVREALRMRPDRVIVGECRGSEVRELLAALNTGHDGGAGTLHANSLDDVPARLEALGALAGMSVEAVARQSVSAINLVVQLERVAGFRRVARMGRFDVDARGRLSIAAEAESTC